MASDLTVRDFVTLQRGLTYKGALVGKPGPALLGLGSIVPGGGFRPDFKTYGGECPLHLMLAPGDLYVSLKGATKDGEMIGSIARVPDTVPSGRLTQDTVGLKFHDGSADSRSYLYWCLRTPQYRDYCRGHATGSAVVALSRDDFLNYPIPPLNSARLKLVKLFDAIEAKIELNRRMNATLEGIARALFKSWFIDFDPVHAKAAGKRPPGLDKPTAALFPDAFAESPLGPIPEGWRITTLEECTALIIDHRGKTPLKLGGDWSSSGGIPALSAKNVKGGKILRSELNNFVDQVLFQKWMRDPLAQGDIILTSEAPMGELAFLSRRFEFCLSQRVYGIRADRDVCESEYLYYWLASEPAQADLAGRCTGTTVLGIRQSELRKAFVLLPPKKLQKVAAKIFATLLEKQDLNDDVSSQLETSRDLLLAQLLDIQLPPEVTSRGDGALMPSLAILR